MNRFMFLRDKQYRPIGCVVMAVDRRNHRVNYQYSVLNPVDDFNRALARQIALGRLIEKPIKVPLYRGEEINIHLISEIVLTEIATGNAPSRAKKAALLWLNKL
jgi:hypothetical protein